jgi:hypothetical protein
MNTQLSIAEFIQKQLSQQEQNYMTALRSCLKIEFWNTLCGKVDKKTIA